jgi:hypothetical protein
MYQIQNVSGSNVAMMLERGGIVLRPSQYLDLETSCSRIWIFSSLDLKHLLEVGTLRLVHDSEQGVPSQPIGDVFSTQKHVEPIKVKAVEIVDLSEHPDIEVDDFGRVVTSAVEWIPETPVEKILVQEAKESVVPKLPELPKVDEQAEEKLVEVPKPKQEAHVKKNPKKRFEDPVEQQIKNFSK